MTRGPAAGYDESQIELRNAEKNLDGYGVSWYADGEEFPRRVRSALPIVDAAGNADAKLMDLIGGSAVPMLFRDSPESCTEEPLKPPGERLRSRALFAHVRAASPGLALNEQNSHPFAFQTLTWLHNGAIWGFEAFRDELVASLPERVLRLVAGTTDSELAGAVFASHLAGWPTRRAYDLLSLRAAMLATVGDRRGNRTPRRRGVVATRGMSAPRRRGVAATRLRGLSTRRRRRSRRSATGRWRSARTRRAPSRPRTRRPLR